jgi:hypothetical protein
MLANCALVFYSVSARLHVTARKKTIRHPVKTAPRYTKDAITVGALQFVGDDTYQFAP